jgi:two-component system cell cycle response regulator
VSDNPSPYDFDESAEMTAVVTLADLRQGRRQAKDRHLLIRARGAQLGHVTKLGAEPLRVGRSQECELWLNDDGVSRKHAVLRREGPAYVIEDTQSANGTFVGGQRIESVVLRDGDLIQFGPQAVFRYSLADENQETLLRQLYEASVTDALTGANNREHFDSQLRVELSYAKRHSTDVALVLFDVDHFKRVNDTHGHTVGDDVLIEIARIARSMVRGEDVFARYGGEEFALILRARIADTEIPTGAGPLQITISVGCATIREAPESTAEVLLQTADKRLYSAKRNGRNRVASSE